MVTLREIQAAREKIAKGLRVTPVVTTHDHAGQNILIKLESLHRTGSFKERGALHKLICLTERKATKEIVAASAGNHAQAISYHGKRLGFGVTIVMPEQAPLTKVVSTQRWGAEVILKGSTFDAATEHAKSIAGAKKTFVHAFDDEEVVAGQGTLGLELLEQIPDLSWVVIPVGGGGLSGGTALALKEMKPSIHITGVQTALYPYTYRAFKGKSAQGKSKEPLVGSIADGIATKKVGEVTLPILKKYIDEMVLVSEDEIAGAIFHLLENAKCIVEGAGAAAMAALLHKRIPAKKGRGLVVISGGNIDVNLISQVIEKGLVKSQRMARLDVVIPDRPGGLKGLTTLLADLKTNIHQIRHERASSEIPVFATGTTLTLETRGEEHLDEIISALRTHGYRVTLLH